MGAPLRRGPVLALAAMLACLAGVLAGSAAASPLDGNGSRIWYVSASGGSPNAVARQAKRRNLDVVYAKSSDGDDRWSQFSPELVSALHRRGITACAWPFVYGDEPGREAKLTASAADAGADCIVIDAESAYEGRYRQAYVYMRKLRKLVGDDYPLALAGFPYTDYRPSFPYTVFFGAGLRETGRIGDTTWKQLIKREPISTNWKRTPVPKALKRSRAPTVAPAEMLMPAKAGTEADRVADPGAGPVALKRVGVGQDKLRGSIRFTVSNPLPPLRQLHRYPEKINSNGRYLCLIADGNAITKRLICVGGEVKKNKVEVGVSRYHKGGGTKKVRRLKVKLKRVSSHAIRLEFPLRSVGFEPGRFRYAAVSSWRGPECDNGGGRNVCRSRVPKGKRTKGKINKVERVGCTAGVNGFTTHGPGNRKRVALTFDDGPSIYTDDVLRILDDKHITATFFEIGTQAGGDYSGVMRKIVAHGHELANHSYRHETLPGRDSMAATSNRIRQATGFEPCHFRPPGGAYNSGTISTARSLGMGTVNWSIDTNDWNGPPSAGTIQSRATGGGPGTIVLMHDGGGNRSNTVAALPGIIDSYRKRGYKMVTLTELLGGHFKLREKH